VTDWRFDHGTPASSAAVMKLRRSEWGLIFFSIPARLASLRFGTLLFWAVDKSCKTIKSSSVYPLFGHLSVEVRHPNVLPVLSGHPQLVWPVLTWTPSLRPAIRPASRQAATS
jgi:hypothetical protein